MAVSGVHNSNSEERQECTEVTNVIHIEKFGAEYRVKQMGGGEVWYPCDVIGVAYTDSWLPGEFVILTEDDDGALYAGSASVVRRLPE